MNKSLRFNCFSCWNYLRQECELHMPLRHNYLHPHSPQVVCIWGHKTCWWQIISPAFSCKLTRVFLHVFLLDMMTDFTSIFSVFYWTLLCLAPSSIFLHFCCWYWTQNGTRTICEGELRLIRHPMFLFLALNTDVVKQVSEN